MPAEPVLYWHRSDLRLADLPGLHHAHSRGHPVLSCFVLDDNAAGQWRRGANSRWWLHHSLEQLSRDLEARGAGLWLGRGDTVQRLLDLARECGAQAIHCSRAYEPWAVKQEQDLLAGCRREGIELRRFPGTLLHEPESVHTNAGTPYRVFTPFWRSARTLPVRHCAPAPDRDAAWADAPAGLSLADLELASQAAAGVDIASHWQPGEAGAGARLQAFLENLAGYREGRDFPGRSVTSRLSPHLHFGELSPAQVWHAVSGMAPGESDQDRDKFLSELAWREFNYHLLHHFPHIPERAFRSEYAALPSLQRETLLEAWQQGRTGYPIVDAGMRELHATGYMHNRVRMVAASFLTKHLLLPWQLGARWFWEQLVDADLANNSGGWQWVAGCGADAAPFFRVFNPTLQGSKFDGDGAYVRRWVPELAGLPDKYLHEPASAPGDVLSAAGVDLGRDYPLPVVNHAEARNAALDAYRDMSSATTSA